MKKYSLKILFFISLFTLSAVCLSCTPLSASKLDLSDSASWHYLKTFWQIKDYPIVFIHGIAGGFSDWQKTADIISDHHTYEMRFLDKDKIYHNYYGKKPKIWVWNVSYYTIFSLEESFTGYLDLYAERLKQMIAVIKQITGSDKVVICAHSMGGLIARKYMSMDQQCWDSVYKVLTVATPHQGVGTSFYIVGQLRDLRPESEFIKNLNTDWLKFDTGPIKKWGVIAGLISSETITDKIDGIATDGAGIGYVTLSSAIPFKEWKDALEYSMESPSYNTLHFGFRRIIRASHVALLTHPHVLEGIRWAVR
ncbi:esterase/lipase family protein [Thermoproteota archaeon]